MYTSNDYYTRKARQQGYAARSVYKLEQIDRRWRLLRASGRVLELGAAPGGWSRYVLQRVGRQGELVAVDLQPLKLSDSRLLFHQEDLTSPRLAAELLRQPRFDLLLSDVAPATTGNRLVDASRSAALVETVVGLGEKVLKKDARLLVKLFDGQDTAAIRERLRRSFCHCHTVRPKAVRSSSCEIYLLGVGLRGE